MQIANPAITELSPQMPVFCARCLYAVRGSVPEIIHCVHGVKSIIKEAGHSQLCSDFVPDSKKARVSA